MAEAEISPIEEEAGEEEGEGGPEEEEEETAGGGGGILSAEGIIMLFLAAVIDIGGLSDFIPLVGQVLSFIFDVMGIIFIGVWIWFRSGTMKVTGRAGKRIGGLSRQAKRMKWLRPLCFIGEFIPFAGILPLWTVLVWFELKS